MDFVAVVDQTLALLRQVGASVEPISRDEVVAIEPALAHTGSKFVGALHGRSDEVGDGRRFTEALAETCKSHGVTFRLDTTIDGLEMSGDRVAALKTAGGLIKADAFVIAAGSWYAGAAFPLTEAARQVQNEIGPLEKQARPITPENPIPRRTFSVDPVYPAEAGAAGISPGAP